MPASGLPQPVLGRVATTGIVPDAPCRGCSLHLAGVVTRGVGCGLASDGSQRYRLPMSSSGRQAPARRARAIAFYLPQFHPIPENDEWWGAGFTEWRNVRKARPLFEGHRQPRVPGELGYYDLRDSGVRKAQADLARAHGVEGFCYWHYWFAGRRLLERPFEAVLSSGEPDFPFCLAWANHSWTAAWVGRPFEMLQEQTYPGREDYRRHFEAVLPAFRDPRYLRVDGKPLFILFRPHQIPRVSEFVAYWRTLAAEAGLGGLHLLGITPPGLSAESMALDGTIETGIGQLLSYQSEELLRRQLWRSRATKVLERPALASIHQLLAHLPPIRRPAPLARAHDAVSREAMLPIRASYDELTAGMAATGPLPEDRHPCVAPNWDNTPRMGRWGVVVEGSSPALYAKHLESALERIADRPDESRLVFLKSWNEWAEGNYLEPDVANGRAFLEATREVLVERVGANEAAAP